ncbi:MAG: hypothetical protein AAF220_09375 [Pseudomonadota bacterium]
MTMMLVIAVNLITLLFLVAQNLSKPVRMDQKEGAYVVDGSPGKPSG